MPKTTDQLAHGLLRNSLSEDCGTCRDDLAGLPLPAAAKKYARRKGLKSMIRQPKDFLKVNAMLTNPGKVDHFQNYTVAKLDGNFSPESGGKTKTGFKVTEGGAHAGRTPRVALVTSRFTPDQYRAWEATLPEDITHVKVRATPKNEPMLAELGFRAADGRNVAGGFWVKAVNNSPDPSFERREDDERDFE